MREPAKTLDRLVARARQLYSLPAVAMKVLELTNNPEVDTHALKQCIENDPALTSKVLRVVNSSLFGLSGEVCDLNQALALLGSKPLKLLVLGFSLPSGLFAGVAAGTLGWYWRRTLTKAVAAREISEGVWRQPGDEGFIAALLQDLGMLLLIQELGAPYIEFLEKVRARCRDLYTFEAEVLGFNHTALTARLLESWGFPAALVEAVVVGPSDDPGAEFPSARQRLVEIVRLAELVARLLADGHTEALAELSSVGQEKHGLSSAQLQKLVETLDSKVRQLAEVFSLQLPRGADYRDVLAQAHAQMAEVAAQAAEELLRGQCGGLQASGENHGLAAEMERLSDAVARLVGAPAEPPPASEPTPAGATRPAPPQSDPALLAQLASAVTLCRQSRSPLSLLLAELGNPEDLVMTFGPEGFQEVVRFLEGACRGLEHPGAVCTPYREAGFAVILPDCERHEAVHLGNGLIERVRHASFRRRARRQAGIALGIGAATVSLPPKNFPAKDLLVAADRCLYSSHASGGAVVRSIEIY